MKFLADQDVYATTIRYLSDLGHDVSSLAPLGLARAEDAELLRYANEQGRILVTRDRDFGALSSCKEVDRVSSIFASRHRPSSPSTPSSSGS
jgi:predicted nuclease of predicted toxin-antitoxin system